MLNKPTYQNIHLRFKLNGNYYSREELAEVAYSFVKEGEPYEQSVGDFLMYWLDEKETITVKTSGSTGTPKYVDLSKQSMVESALASGDYFGISVGDSALHCLPADFIAGKMMLVRAMILGLEIDLLPPVTHPMREVNRSYDFAAMIPVQVENSLGKLNLIKKLIVGGAPVSDTLIHKLQDKDTEVYETYGMTETVTHIAAKKLNHLAQGEEQENMHFIALPQVSLSLDERGCLVIRAPYLMDEEVVTNDLVRLYEDNAFDWLGRIDNIINSGGVKLMPEILEQKYSSCIKGRYFVHGLPDEALGQRLALFVEGADQDTEAIMTCLRANEDLAKHEIPKEIVRLEHFEETENGKVIRESSVARWAE